MTKSSRAPLSQAQREIMDIIWDRGEASVFEIREVLSEQKEIARETVRTLLTRMEEKGWLKHRVVGRTYIYSATIPRETRLAQRVIELVDTMCGGSPEKLVTALLDHRGLTEDEARRIRDMIVAAKKTRNKDGSNKR